MPMFIRLFRKKEYRKEKAEDILDNWFDGSAKELFTALSEKIPKKRKKRKAKRCIR